MIFFLILFQIASVFAAQNTTSLDRMIITQNYDKGDGKSDISYLAHLNDLRRQAIGLHPIRKQVVISKGVSLKDSVDFISKLTIDNASVLVGNRNGVNIKRSANQNEQEEIITSIVMNAYAGLNYTNAIKYSAGKDTILDNYLTHFHKKYPKPTLEELHHLAYVVLFHTAAVKAMEMRPYPKINMFYNFLSAEIGFQSRRNIRNDVKDIFDVINNDLLKVDIKGAKKNLHHIFTQFGFHRLFDKCLEQAPLRSFGLFKDSAFIDSLIGYDYKKTYGLDADKDYYEIDGYNPLSNILINNDNLLDSSITSILSSLSENSLYKDEFPSLSSFSSFSDLLRQVIVVTDEGLFNKILETETFSQILRRAPFFEDVSKKTKEYNIWNIALQSYKPNDTQHDMSFDNFKKLFTDVLPSINKITSNDKGYFIDYGMYKKNIRPFDRIINRLIGLGIKIYEDRKPTEHTRVLLRYIFSEITKKNYPSKEKLIDDLTDFYSDPVNAMFLGETMKNAHDQTIPIFVH